ncbi:MAG TPA: bifunctional hydroxymethylpyrimidine kinase/phosphomethylpyrimidine kinase [Ottowia sp.]|uniref:bifunctional hydroxymethylpyrimidine kinase/phosphomethylpyrimidine kinase n=1 Tax=Ottowia sp. TaxID=1898956 RepID=UPI002B65E50A|nr:bifunctional hydroxymethylpyrimidine kinase/phosphomethylpyrimidine kinase [Ottowia sp.]HMN20732.1 bifunctional hydroxymethylpyrimidine kinase/phosphomethylpyrimidine kinase [Ottowia sp.]
MNQQYVRVLTIAGSDSGGGAGIQADLKTFAALGCYGMSAITALTAQNTLGVTAIHGVPVEFLVAQIDAVMSDIGAHAVKIGMLHAPEVVQAVAAAIDRHAMRQVVLDPVMVSATGARLIEPEAVQALVAELFPRACLITPNLDEAALLLGRSVRAVSDMLPAAEGLLQRGARAVLLKGGHLPGETVHDLLLERGQAPLALQAPRVATHNLHGAGCTLSSAIAAHLAQGAGLASAVRAARDFVHAALTAGAPVRTGHGVGPLAHGFAPLALRTLALG